jgi:hypothetical protein
MRFFSALRNGVLISALCAVAQGQDTQIKDPQINEAKGMPPRAAPADYQAQEKAGTMTIGAEFLGHSFLTPEGTLSTEDYVVVETGLFDAPGVRIRLSLDDFSLRINGKKSPLPRQAEVLVFKSLKDPEWEPAAPAGSKSKTSIGGSGKGGQGDNSPPPVVHIPIGVQRAMEQRVRKAALPEGDRALPQAGLIFFQYRGKVQGINSIELIYAGPAGNATLTLQK